MNTEDSEFERIEREIKTKALPDAIHHTDLGESLEYIKGWNDCRAAMLAEQPEHHDPIGVAQDRLIAEQALAHCEAGPEYCQQCYKEAMKLALDALENSIDLVSQEARNAEELYGKYPTRLARIQGLVAFEVAHEKAITVLKALAEKQTQQEPVGCEWTPCMKLPVVVHVRKQYLGEAHVSTREGITPVHPDDLIMRGVSGEEYPIGITIFLQTYTLDTTPQAQRKPLTNLEGLKLAYNHHWLNNRAGVDAYLLGIRDAEAAHGIKDNQS